MKVIVAGTRSCRDPLIVRNAIIQSPFHGKITELVSGRAPGVDTTAEALAELHRIPVKGFPADWDTHGRAAGPLRNRQMAMYADALIAVWDGHSRGTRDMILQMKALNKPVFVYKYSKPTEEDGYDPSEATRRI